MKAYALLIVALFCGNAMASKARVNSLLGADHLVDPQTIFTVPSHVQLLSPFMTYEFGAQGAGAEGGIMRKVGPGNLFAYLGHQNTTNSDLKGDTRVDQGYISQNNPIEVIYGVGNMGFGASLSRVNNSTADTEEMTVVGKWGMNITNESWAWAHVHLISQAEKPGTGGQDEINAGPYLSGGLSWAIGNARLFGQVDLGQGEQDFANTATQDQDIKTTNLLVGVEDRSLKTANADIYYGIALDYNKREYESNEASSYQLPVFMGIEAPVVSWATVRASVRQNVLLGESKDETTTPSTKSGINSDTLVAAGLGFKYNNFQLDGSLTAASNGNINGSQFLSQASITYNF